MSNTRGLVVARRKINVLSSIRSEASFLRNRWGVEFRWGLIGPGGGDVSGGATRLTPPSSPL